MTIQKQERGISLVMASAVLLIVFLLSTVSLSMVTSNAVLTRSIYSQSVVLVIAEDGPAYSSPEILEDASDGFIEILAEEDFFNENINYSLFGDVTVAVSIRDNDDLDDSTASDVDKTFILRTEGYIVDDESKAEADQVRIAATALEVLVRYVGNDDEYAQETGSARSNSNFASEVEVSDF